MSTDRPSYSIGESVTATVELTNMGLVAQDVHTVVQIQKFAYGYVTLAEQTIDLNLLPYTAGDTATQIRTLTFPLPAGLTPGSTYTVRVQSSIGTERVGLDAATFRFTAPYVVGLRVDRPDRRYGAGDPIQISADIQNISASPRETDVEIAAPALGSPQTQHVTLGPGATQTISYSTSVPVSMASGVHDITVTLSDGGLTKMSNFVVPAPRLHLDVDAPSHNAGEELHLLIENIGGTYVEWTGTLSADFAAGPGCGYGKPDAAAFGQHLYAHRHPHRYGAGTALGLRQVLRAGELILPVNLRETYTGQTSRWRCRTPRTAPGKRYP